MHFGRKWEFKLLANAHTKHGRFKSISLKWRKSTFSVNAFHKINFILTFKTILHDMDFGQKAHPEFGQKAISSNYIWLLSFSKQRFTFKLCPSIFWWNEFFGAVKKMEYSIKFHFMIHQKMTLLCGHNLVVSLYFEKLIYRM